MHFTRNLFAPNLQQWEQEGHQCWQMFEWIGGGHPSQVAQMLNAEGLWAIMKEKWPETLGEVNPNNDKIEALFGDQGGY